ncbi:hypothetical protein [Chachezhania antarctica]|uniref:hypothetical protein n=1 Tax=Chachezhania antarctica TaxID=2340860 RepID=UPI000EAC9FBE|nr:hypothetical protein [Chachezhania antarctica]
MFDHPLTMVQSGTQAQRLRWIEGQRLLLQKRFSSVGPPEMIQLLPGARVTGALPDRPRFNGSWQAVSLRSAASLTGDDEGVALRTPFVLREYSDAVFAYDAELHEQELTTLPTDFAYPQVEPPGEIEITAGPDVDFDAGSAIVSRLRFAAPPSPTASVTHYELQMTNVTADEPGAWISGGLIDADLRDTSGKVYGWIHNPPVHPEFDIRLRAMVGSSASPWVVKESVSVDFEITVNSATAGAGEAGFNVTMPGTLIGQGARIWRAETGDGFGAAGDIGGVLAVGPGETADITAAADAGEADFFVTAVSRTGSDGPAAGPFTLTIT